MWAGEPYSKSQIKVIQMKDSLLDCELSFPFGLAWPKTITAAIKFHNKLKQRNTHIGNIHVDKAHIKNRKTSLHVLKFHVEIWVQPNRKQQESDHYQNSAVKPQQAPTNATKKTKPNSAVTGLTD